MTKTQATPDNAETREFKDGARRLQEYLKTQGISLKQAQALEALTASLAMPNWQTLRAKLTAPAQAAGEVLGPDEPRWMVNAIYTDNNQRFSDDYHGATPLEAQIACQLDRLADEGWMTEVEISCVIDRTTGKIADQESHPEEVQLLKFSKMLSGLVKLAKPHLGTPPQRGIAEAEEFDRNMRALEFWTSISSGKDTGSQVARDALDEMYGEYAPEYDEGSTTFKDSRGVEDDIDVVDAFQRLVNLASTGKDLSKPGDDPKRNGIFHLLQGKLTLEYFGTRLGKVLADWEAEALDA